MNNAKKSNDIPLQETTSTYFNNILKKEVKPKSIEELNPEILTTFENSVEDAFEDASDRQHRLLGYNDRRSPRMWRRSLGPFHFDIGRCDQSHRQVSAKPPLCLDDP